MNLWFLRAGAEGIHDQIIMDSDCQWGKGVGNRIKLDSCDGCTTLNILKTTLLVNFMIYKLYINNAILFLKSTNLGMYHT
jgi:hypothetical protein